MYCMCVSVCVCDDHIIYSEASLIRTPVNPIEHVLISDVEMHARVVLGVGKGVLFREVSSIQWCPYTK